MKKIFLRLLMPITLNLLLCGCNDNNDFAPQQPELPQTNKRNYIQMVGDEAYIISKYDSNYDIIVHFAKTLKNDLFTVRRIYLAENTDTELLTEHRRPVAVLLSNQESSDMIGPLSVRTGNDLSWIGANHLYLNQTSGVKSSRTDSYTIYADGKEITVGCTYADNITVQVLNTIFDPNVAPSEGDTILSSPLIKESIAFNVDQGEILVGVEHKYLKDVYVGIYYGMQSMFITGTQFITADCGFSDWQEEPTSGEINIKKSIAPQLSRFSQKSASGYYQNTILLRYGLGKHEYLDNESPIFKWAGQKIYHVLIHNRTIPADTSLSWMGIYNWNKPLTDDDTHYIYAYNVNGIEYLSVTAKGAESTSITKTDEYDNESCLQWEKLWKMCPEK